MRFLSCELVRSELSPENRSILEKIYLILNTKISPGRLLKRHIYWCLENVKLAELCFKIFVLHLWILSNNLTEKKSATF